MIKIYTDDLISRLQNNGGISTVWRLLKQNTIFTIEWDSNEKVYLFGLPFSIGYLPDALERFLDVSSPPNTIFHSTYLRLGRGKGVVNIVTVHDCIYERYSKGFRLCLHKLQMRRVLRKSNLIVSVSESTKRDIVYFYPFVHSNKIKVIHNGYDNESFFVEENQSASKSILYVGTRNDHKGFSDFLKVLSQLPDTFKAEVIGRPFSKGERKEIPKNLLSRIEVHSNVSIDELRKRYNESLVFIYPSLFEGFGIPVIEAMACGCPVICRSNSSLTEVGGRAALFTGDDFVKDAIQFILRLTENSAFRRQVVNLGLTNAQRFESQIMADKYLELYKRVDKVK